MTKVKHALATLIFLTGFFIARAQVYAVRYVLSDSGRILPDLQNNFPTKEEAAIYISRLPTLLHSKGFASASVDRVVIDSMSAEVELFLGEKYQWSHIQVKPEDEDLLKSIRMPQKVLSGNVDVNNLNVWQQKILDYLEENGHPFGKVFLDSIAIDGQFISGILKIDRGPLYRIDSIRINGDVKVSNSFMQRYLDIPNGSIYNKKKLQNISNRLAQLTYLQEDRPSDLVLMGSGSILNIYVKARRTSQANILVGLLPNSVQTPGEKNKFLLTIDANVLLRNALGSGETIGLLWQQLQKRSPRLNLLYEQPYFAHSPFGLTFTVDMYKQDSLYLNINMNLGTNYRLEERKITSIFLQRRQTIVSGINSNEIIQSKQLPQQVDVSSWNLGVGYQFNNTDYRFNPRKGNELAVTGTTGLKKIRKNSQILDLEDPSDPSFKFESLYDTLKLKAYQFRFIGTAAHFFPLGKQSTIKAGVNTGIYQSDSYFRNELFQIGGFKLLRGFNEESQFVSKYVIGTVEYRLRLSLNSMLFAFTDGGYGRHELDTEKDHTYFGTGVGLSFETKAGIINLAWAVGMRDDEQLNLRQSKIHVGLASFF
ncbi:MAG: BamA/TamA family outer membrane protein [Flavisolibacter sp.]